MYQIPNISDDPKQILRVQFEGKNIDLRIWYEPTQMGWFFGFTYLDYTSTGIRITSCPNLIRQVKDTLGFGLCCKSEGEIDPLFQTDFSTGRAKLYILTAEEVQQIEEELYVKV